ncbi:molybdopterin synthase sulfur carrier subunit [Campylobacter sputorum subsp. bubulus]|uniref:Molybdopterin synthase sulfur carrier subunit n=1 Tax=Campylobacter sputorum subsp. sputorum TaxID=32024 RepID=A0A381DIN4_9BACT|nr:MoaD/ThiS family protein [Campylobacter sputorum]ASM35374.1 molybdopterin synthase, small subunit [Campylobacter sputorum aubsp. sputorum RM3237]ASM37074.1 molybdopterin synthase, small subunit [Campylobacter sputorum bv. faecalis CCUG 20703]KAB0582881.1 MoaD/ThiS family protein [Campylobacter sputorum subsp. sputorum]QEL05566.1 molybdopterin synthase, small subunit [Campylobacter sputorum subsp. sputorum]SUX08613.1 molybdopterin synthase sulfur carrier subunit [Campylobacter sputorum subsp
MVEVEFLGPIGHEKLSLDVKNLKELKEVLAKYENLKQWLEISGVALNDKMISSLDINLKDGDKISILPPVCGG